MCGIVGYVGKKNAQDFLISGLKRLEYRGYDSAGIVTLSEKGEPTLIRAKGKIANLEEKLAENRRDDHIGIGHTRWATHGEPSETNAHPHRAGKIFLVHNGIIENYKELKANLTEHEFKSQTDTEVLAALVNSFYKDGEYPLTNAVVQALKLVKGTYGIAVVSCESPDEIVVARSGSPLVIGVGHDETLIASDASALVGHTKQAIYLNDGEVALVKANSIEVKTLNAEPVSAKVEEIETNLAAIQKGGYDHFLLKEIMEQPESLRETLRGRVNVKEGTVRLGGPGLSEAELRKIRHLVIVGCGTAYHAGLLAGYYIEQFTPEITVETVIASEYRYRNAYIPRDSVALIVSQSGETADTLACLREIKKQGIPTIGIVNAIGSTIAREVDGGTYVHVGPEISVASTKAFTSQVVAIVMFGLTIAQAKGVKPGTLRPYVEEIAKLPEAVRGVLDNTHEKVKEVAAKYVDYEHAIYLGRDTAYPTAMEGALKLKEVAYIDANAYAFGELKHGPLALVDDRFFEFALLPEGALYDKAVSNVQEVLARGGHIVAVTNVENFDLPVESVVKITTELKLFAPLLMNLVSQLFAYYVTTAKGLNVDQPRNLAKSVTVE
ncbi:glutamine--fructose-6-phosphate transaminase (isomerizing) [Candidatus Saccharibacteria bacterium]|nr:glutamine--fructose-6-phosphate transaminase (isomerizing) [Candidatus Saccharibacteria bacterium]MBQ6375702.1 glutamine--fructose-6-phosphate transaminase (isomerizing) [Candidatus Saccharibacteria bacterium]